MSLRARAWKLILAGLLATPAGCMGPAGGGTANLSPPASPAAAAADELPAAKAAAACLVVAQHEEKNGNEAAAREQYEKAEKLDPKNVTPSRRLAVLYDKQCEFAKADAEYKKVAQARPNDADVLNDWGYSLYLRNNGAEATTKLKRAVELDPHNARAHSNLGLALGRQERYGEALQEFLAAGLSEAEAHSNLAFIYLTKGKMDDARRECETARQKDPYCTKAQEMLARMDAPPRPRGDNAVQTASLRRPDAAPPPPPADDGAPAGKYPLPPGWAPVPPHAAPPADAGVPGDAFPSPGE